MFRLAAIVGLSCALLSAQEFRSTISGRVMDPTGAAVSGVSVVATESNTGAKAETTTGAEGSYSLPFLPPGPYTITAEQGGFKKHVQSGITVGTNMRLSVDITLQLGSQSDAITVSADAAMLQTNSASVGQVITERQISVMPMNGRTPLTLAQLSYGVTPTSDPRFTRPFDNAGPSGFSMGGGQGQSNELLLDGSPDMTRNRRVAYNPPVDAVQEIKVESFQPDAAYGNTGGGTVNVVMKGGTNDFHGSLYEFHQNQRLKATPFFTNANNQTKPVTRFNQFGMTVGGPIIIPKIINGKNKLFFFFGSEGIRQSEPEPTFSTVPTEAQRRGDFSQLLNVNNTYQIYDPATGVPDGSQIRRQVFPGNIIPANRLNPVAKNFLQFVPLPNTPGAADGTNNYFNNAVRSDVFSSFMGRIDVNASDKHKFFLSGRYNDRVENRGNRFSNIAAGNNLLRTNWGLTFDDVYTLSPSMFLNTRLNWTRFVEASIRPSDGFDFTSLGLPASLKAASSKLVIPRIAFNSITTPFGDSGGDRTPYDSYQIFVASTKIAGRHTMKFGADLRSQRESSNSFGNSSGLYNFRNEWTRGPLGNAPGAPLGQDMAAFLLGLPFSGAFDVNATRTQSADYMAFFFQDDFKVSSTLSLNLGLRYEKETGTIERYNRTVRGFDQTAALSVTGPAKANYAAAPVALLPAAQFNPVGGVLFADPSNRTIYDPPNNAWSPRFGLSWSPRALGGKTVLRGGYGIFYSTFGTAGIQQPGFSQTTQLVSTLDNFLTPAATFSNPFPNGILQPVGNANGVNTFVGQGVRFNSPDLKQPITHRWNLNIQRELGKNLLLELGYMGSDVRNLGVTRNLNFVPAQYLSDSPTRDQANINRLTALVPNPFRNLLPGTNLNGSTTATENLLRRYPQFSNENGVIMDGQTIGYSNFHMFQVRLDKRFANGFQFLTNFQWSKFMEATNRLYEASDELNYRIANEDRPFRWVFSGTYELPFGKGKSFGSGVGGLGDRVIGGWQIAGILNLQSGAPVTFGNVIYYGGDLQWDPRNLASAFDKTRFERSNLLQLDRNRRSFKDFHTAYRSDKIYNIDLSAIKAIPIVERFNLQFRVEAFNLFNHAIFNGPEMNPTNNNFGRITSQANLPRTLQLALRLTF